MNMLGGHMATYKQIQEDIKKRHGKSVKTCWIAHVKELNGLNPGVASNRINKRKRKVPCPDIFRPIIEQLMRRFRMI